MVHHNAIRLVHHFERLAFVTKLPTALFGRPFGKARLLGQTVRRGRLVTVLAVQVQREGCVQIFVSGLYF